MVDDYGGYKMMFAADAKFAITELGCWAYARRKFFDLQVSGRIHRRRKRCGVSPNFTLSKRWLAKWIMQPVENTVCKAVCQYWRTCISG